MTSLTDKQHAIWLTQVGKLGRAPAEWIGKTPDTKVPERVRDRILRTWDSTCYLSKVEIRPGQKWEIEHFVALSAGGQHRESNLRPALTKAHKEKTRAESKIRAKADAQRRASNGTKAAPAKEIKSAGFQPTAKEPKSRSPLGPPRPMFR